MTIFQLRSTISISTLKCQKLHKNLHDITLIKLFLLLFYRFQLGRRCLILNVTPIGNKILINLKLFPHINIIVIYSCTPIWLYIYIVIVIYQATSINKDGSLHEKNTFITIEDTRCFFTMNLYFGCIQQPSSLRLYSYS